MMHKENDLDQVIGRPPGWGLRWGLWVVLGGMAVLVLATFLICYSDVVEAPVVLTTKVSPFKVTAAETRTIEELLVTEGQIVASGSPLLEWDSDAERKDVQLLEASLATSMDIKQLANLFSNWSRPLQLGNIDLVFIHVRKAARQYSELENDALYDSRIRNIRNQVAEQQALALSLQQQTNTLQEEVQLAASNAERDSILLKQRSLSEWEYDATRAFYLQKRRELEALQSESIRNRLMGKQLGAAILDLQQQHKQATEMAHLELESALMEMKSAIAGWKELYLLMAPTKGKVELPAERRNGEVVKAGDLLLTLVPENEAGGKLQCRAYIPVGSIAKLKPGMDGRIRLLAYPWQQHGELNAILTKIAEVPEKGAYEAVLELPDGLKTAQGNALEFHHELTGTVRITTEKRSLMKRLLTKLKW